MPLSTFIQSRTGFEPVFYARVEGLPFYFYANRQPSWSPPSGSSWRRGLLLPDASVEMSIDLVQGLPKVGGMTVEFQDDADGFFRMLFAAGRWDADADVRRTQVTGAGITRTTTTTIPVLDASQFDAVALPADFHSGNETIRVSAKDNVANTLTIAASGRGRFPPVGSTGFRYDHIPQTSPAFEPPIAAVVSTPGFSTPVPCPYTWIGRTVALYINYYDPDAAAYGAESESVLIFVGPIRSKDYTADDTWRLACVHVTDLLERDAFSRLGQTTIRHYSVRDDIRFTFSLSNRTTGAAVGSAGVTLVAGSYAGWEGVRETLQPLLNAMTFSGTPTINKVTMERVWQLEAGGETGGKGIYGRTVFVGMRDSAGAVDDVMGMSIEGYDDAMAIFGLAPVLSGSVWREDGTIAIGGTQIITAINAADVVAGTHRNSVCVLGPIPIASVTMPPAAGQFIYLENTDTLTAAQDTTGNDLAFFLVGDQWLVSVDQVDTANRRLRVSSAYIGLAPGFTGTPDSILRQMAPDAPPIRVAQVYMPVENATLGQVPVSQMIGRLLYSTGSASYNHTTYDRLPRGWGLAIPASLIDTTLVQTIAQLTSVDWRRYFFDRPVRMSELIQSEAALFNWGLTWRSGRIAAIELGQTVAPPGAVAITTATRAARVDPHRAGPTDVITSRESVATLVNQFKVEMDRAPGTDSYKVKIVLSNTVSQNAFNEVRAVTVKNPGLLTGDLADAWGGTLGAILANKMDRFHRPVAVVSLQVSRYHYDLYPGQVVLLSDDRFPNPFTGARGITSVPARIVSVRFDYREMVGAVTAVIDPGFLYSRYANIAPTARVTARAAGAPNDTLDTLTLSVNEFTDAAARVDIDLFDVSDAVRIVEADPTTPAAPQQWQRTILTKAGNDITVATLAGYNAAKTYYVEFDIWSVAVTSQRTDACFEGDSADDRIENSGRTYLWT